MSYSSLADAAIDADALRALAAVYGPRAVKLPPVALGPDPAGRRPVFALLVSALTGQQVSDTTFGLRAMRAELTGAVRLEQPQYQASELLIGIIAHGYRVLELPATIRKRKAGMSKKGQNPFYRLSSPAVNNVFYGTRFTRVVLRTWWRERRRPA